MKRRMHKDIFASDIEWLSNDPGIDYARFRLDDENANAPAVILAKFDPGVEVPPHTHDSNYFEYILEGEQTVGKITFGRGDVRLVKGGTGYGPIKVGDQGCTVLIAFEDGSRSLMETLPRKRG